MNVFDAIKSRRSVRKYKNRPIEKEKIRKVLEAGRLAPSAHNSQPWKFYVVKTKGREKKLVDVAKGQKFAGEAPVIIVVCGDPSASEYCESDCALAIENMVLEAKELDLGTCIIGWFDKNKARSFLNIPRNLEIFYMLPLGYPDEDPRPRGRKDLEDVTEFIV